MTAKERDARIAALRDMIEVQGLSYRQAGEQLGMTRAAATGLGNRAGIKSPRPPGWQAVNKDKAESKPAHANPAVTQEKARRARAKAQQPVFAPPATDPTPLRNAAWRPLEGREPVEIEHHTTGCRWPIDIDGRTLFCNAPARHGVYCEAHQALSGRPDPPRLLKPRAEKERLFNGEYH